MIIISFLLIVINFNGLTDSNTSIVSSNSGKSYDMVIISSTLFADELQPFIAHKNSVGIQTYHETTEHIYTNYSGQDHQEQIKYYIKDAIETNGIDYVLLIGNESHLPVRIAQLEVSPSVQNLPSDLYYADIYRYNQTSQQLEFEDWDSNNNGIFAEWNNTNKDILDLYPDVCVGRIPCRNETEAVIAINKIITYETQPVGFWFSKVLLCGGDSCIIPDEPVIYPEGELINDKIASFLGNEQYLFQKLWASNNNLTISNINNAINNGVGFIDFSGYGSYTSWKTHPLNDINTWIPNGGYTKNDALTLANEHRLPLIMLSGSYCCDITTIDQSIAEAFLMNSNGGSIGILGSTSDVFYYCSDAYNDGLFGYIETTFFQNYANGFSETLGDLWAQTCVDYISNNPVMNDRVDGLTIESFILLGDPSLKISGYMDPYPVNNLDTGEGFNSIQLAIDDNDTLNGHTIYVKNGTYYENLNIIKSISLLGENKNSTVIDGQGSNNVITVRSPSVKIAGFTIQNSGTANYDDAGVNIKSNECTIINNIISQNEAGMWIITDNNTIQFNIIDDNYEAIRLAHIAKDNIILENNISNNYFGIYLHYCEENNIISNLFENNYLVCYLDSSKQKIFNNTLKNNVRGINVFGGQNNVSHNVIINSTDYPISLSGNNNSVHHNILLSNQKGLMVLGNKNKITNNTITNTSETGIYLLDSNATMVFHNHISNDYDSYGIWIRYATNCTMNGNVITKSSEGIRIHDDAYNNTIINNLIHDNTNGIKIIDVYYTANNNSIYHNNFINNSQNAIDEFINIWDNGYPSGGNYWDDYTGIDINNDGIGEMPYNISAGNNQDNYPFTHPNGWLIEIDINQSNFNRGFPIRHAADGDWGAGQNFVPNYDILSYTQIYIRKFGSPEFNLTIELRENAIDGPIVDTLIFTPEEIPSTWTWLELDFKNIIATSGIDYFIKCPPAPSGVTTSFGYEWGYAFGNQYDDGAFWFTRDGGSLWRDLPTMYEFVFKTYGYEL